MLHYTLWRYLVFHDVSAFFPVQTPYKTVQCRCKKSALTVTSVGHLCLCIRMLLCAFCAGLFVGFVADEGGEE